MAAEGRGRKTEENGPGFKFPHDAAIFICPTPQCWQEKLWIRDFFGVQGVIPTEERRLEKSVIHSLLLVLYQYICISICTQGEKKELQTEGRRLKNLLYPSGQTSHAKDNDECLCHVPYAACGGLHRKDGEWMVAAAMAQQTCRPHNPSSSAQSLRWGLRFVPLCRNWCRLLTPCCGHRSTNPRGGVDIRLDPAPGSVRYRGATDGVRNISIRRLLHSHLRTPDRTRDVCALICYWVTEPPPTPKLWIR